MFLFKLDLNKLKSKTKVNFKEAILFKIKVIRAAKDIKVFSCWINFKQVSIPYIFV